MNADSVLQFMRNLYLKMMEADAIEAVIKETLTELGIEAPIQQRTKGQDYEGSDA